MMNAGDEEQQQKKKMTMKGSDQEEAPGGQQEPRTGAARTAETLLRVAPMALCVAALVIMVNNSQRSDFGDVSYADLGPFKYLVYTNGVCAAYSLLSAFYAATPRPPTFRRSWMLFFFNQVLTYATLAAGAVSAEVMYLAYNGDEEVTWSSECGVFGGFCRRATASVGITFGVVVCYMLLSAVSSHRLFSAYEVPLPFLSGRSLEVAAFPR